MRIFAVILDADGEAESERVEARLRKKFSSLYRLSPSVFVVAADLLSSELAESAGIKGEDRLEGATGVVFRIDGYSGFTDGSMWEWMGNVEN